MGRIHPSLNRAVPSLPAQTQMISPTEELQMEEQRASDMKATSFDLPTGEERPPVHLSVPGK